MPEGIGVGSGSVAVTNQVALAATATQIIATNSNRVTVTIVNPSTTVTVYLGPTSGVTTSNGQILPPSSAATVEYRGAIYGIVATGTPTVSYWETSTP